MIELFFTDKIKAAFRLGNPVVALESTIISHGMPYPQNVETALSLERIVLDGGAVPATIAILNGKVKVGLSPEEIDYLGQPGTNVEKVSRRDIPFIVSAGKNGATTVAATMIFAAKAGIKVFATGGIGGVHRGGENSLDISADLQELANTNVAVVSAGVKSILDIGRTLEYLETMGVPVIGFGVDEFPAFYTRKSGFGVDYRLDDSKEIAKVLDTKWKMGLKGGVLIGNPIPEQQQMKPEVIEEAIRKALLLAEEKGIKGKAITPFLLGGIKDLTEGDSLFSNIRLVENNAALAARIAVDLSTL